MTATPPTEPFLPVGSRDGFVYALNPATGYINATAVVSAGKIPSYDGIELIGPRAFNLTIPNPRTVPQLGNDRIVAIDLLPPQQPYVGEVHASAINFALDALTSNVKNTNVAGISLLPRYTDQQGSEPIVGFMNYQQGLTRYTKKRIWHAYVMPATRMIPMPSQMTDNPEDFRYYLAPNPSTMYLWGQALVSGTDGASEAGIDDIYSYYKPHIAAWLGDGSTKAVFAFNASYPAVDADHVSVFDNGTPASPTIDPVNGLTFSDAPLAGHIITALYELAS